MDDLNRLNHSKSVSTWNTPIAIKSNNLRGLKFIFSFVWEIYENQNEIKDVKTLYIFWFIWFKSGSVFELITVKGGVPSFSKGPLLLIFLYLQFFFDLTS